MCVASQKSPRLPAANSRRGTRSRTPPAGAMDASQHAEDLIDRMDQERALRATRYPIDALVEALRETGRAEVRARRLTPPDVSPYAGVSPDRAQGLDRLGALWRAGRMEAGDVLVTSAVAWARRGAPHAALDARSIRIACDDELEVGSLRERLLAGGYAHVGLVEDAGTFSVRGDIVDIFPTDDERPVRIELYGDLVESIRRFDPVTQRNGEAVDALHVFPAREELLDEETLASARARLQDLGAMLRVSSNKTSAVLKDLREGVRFFGIETLTPALYPALQSVAERVPADACVLVVEPDAVLAAVEDDLERRRDEYQR